MCGNLFKSPKIAAQPLIPAADNAEASRDATFARAMRRLRGGAASNILTSPTGIPSARPTNSRLGQA